MMPHASSGHPNDSLKRERVLRGWTQAEVAGQIGTDGYTVNRWERGRAVPSPYFRKKLTELFGKDTEALGLLAEHYRDVPRQGFPSVWNVPYRQNLFFTGREGILEQLHQVLEDAHTAVVAQAICGLGGIGKTQVAVEYTYRYQYLYEAILWVQADSSSLLQASFLQLAALLDVPEKHVQDASTVVAAVKQWLREHQHWLLVLDNVEDLQVVSDFIPARNSGHVLLTTRAASAGAVAYRVELGELQPEEGELLLLRRSQLIGMSASLDQVAPAERNAALELSSALGGLPLALDQAAAYIERTGCGLTGYLRRYQKYYDRLLGLRGPNRDYPASVATTWSLSFEKVRQSNPAAAEILQICSLLHPDAIPEEIFCEGASDLGPTIESIVADELSFDVAISELRNFSLIRRHPDTMTLGLHCLVQVIVRENMGAQAQRQATERVVHALNRCFPVWEVEFSTWERCQRYLPHVLACTQSIARWDICVPEAAQLLHRTALYLQERGLYDQAEGLYQQALTLRERFLGPEHPDVADSLDCLASVYEVLWKDPEPLYLRALDIRTRLLGEEHFDVAETLNNLALFYQKKGMYVQAEPLYQRAAAIFEQVAGADHLHVAAVLSNLGAMYYEQGKYAEAEPLYQRATAIREQAIGPDHPLTSIGLRLLALLYQELARYQEAEALCQRALTIREHALGPEHPLVATSYNDLAALYFDLGKYAEAEVLYLHALAIRERTFGPQNPYVARTLTDLANLYTAQTRCVEAERLFLRSLSILERVFGSKHADVAKTYDGLADLYCKQGQYVLALRYGKRALRCRKQCFGKEHLSIAQSMNTLAKVYHTQNHRDRAKRFYTLARAMIERTVGPEHPSMAVSLSGLAELYVSEQQLEAAEPLLQQIRLIRERLAGAGYPAPPGSIEQHTALLRR